MIWQELIHAFPVMTAWLILSAKEKMLSSGHGEQLRKIWHQLSCNARGNSMFLIAASNNSERKNSHDSASPFIRFVYFPSGLFLILISFFFEWLDRKLDRSVPNRQGPRFLQPFAIFFKLLAKEEMCANWRSPNAFHGAADFCFRMCEMTASLYVPFFGFKAAWHIRGDLIIAMYLLSAMTVCLGMAGTINKPFCCCRCTRTLTPVICV
jgi:hypothetical protein